MMQNSHSTPTRAHLTPTAATLTELLLFSAHTCAFSHCSHTLTPTPGEWNGQLTYIHTFYPAEPRSSHTLTPEELRQADNLMLVCPTHHALLNDPAHATTYTSAHLTAMKHRHEANARTAHEELLRSLTNTPTARYPHNVGAFFIGLNSELAPDTIDDMKPWIDSLTHLTLDTREVLLAFVTHHTSCGPGYGPKPFITHPHRVTTAAHLAPHAVTTHTRTLENSGLLRRLNTTETSAVALLTPDPHQIGWDLFAQLVRFARDRSNALETVLLDLDFTVLDTPPAPPTNTSAWGELTVDTILQKARVTSHSHRVHLTAR